MSTPAPQVLSRRTNGPAPAVGSQTHEPTKGGKTATEGNSSRSGKGKVSAEKHGESKSTAHDAESSKPTKTKTPNEGEKVIIRRLPPGMTQSEFVSILGPEWDVGNGKVDWFYYARGKISNDLSKPLRPARAYFHLTRKDHIMALSEVVRNATWEDAKSTFTNPALIGPPSLEFCIYKKVPGNKKRTDARQGTIDQDPEFMAFLEDLANPAPLRESIDVEEAEEAVETKITSTPLVEYLKEKRANKAKDAAGKGSKHSRQEAGGKGKGSSKEEDGSKKKGKESKNSKSEKASSKESVKILTKKSITEQAAEAAKNAAGQITGSASNATSNASETPAPKSRRAGIAAAARILQRDLGLSPGSAHRRARQDAAKAESDSKSAVTKENKEPAVSASAAAAAVSEAHPSSSPNGEASSSQPPAKTQSTAAASSKAQASGRRNRPAKNSDKSKATESTQNPTAPTPVILKKKANASTEAEAPKPAAEAPAATQTTSAKATKETTNGPKGGSGKGSSQKKGPSVTANATRGFVKHANPSQGITEAALKQVLESFGTITFIEMDKRKGFAYVDFSEHAGLAKAISASPITVAQGTIQVLERKDKKPAAPATATSSDAKGAAPASTSAGTSNSTAAPEKNSGRGRRGRGAGGGGGGKGNAAANGTQAAASATAAPATNGTAVAATTNGAG